MVKADLTICLSFLPISTICEDGNNGHGNDVNNYDCSNPGNGAASRIKPPGVFCPLWDPGAC